MKRRYFSKATIGKESNKDPDLTLAETYLSGAFNHIASFSSYINKPLFLDYFRINGKMVKVVLTWPCKLSVYATGTGELLAVSGEANLSQLDKNFIPKNA